MCKVIEKINKIFIHQITYLRTNDTSIDFLDINKKSSKNILN